MQEHKQYNRRVNRKSRSMGTPWARKGSPSSPGFGMHFWVGGKDTVCVTCLLQAEKKYRMNAVFWVALT
jgi:hypothetical protein